MRIHTCRSARSWEVFGDVHRCRHRKLGQALVEDSRQGNIRLHVLPTEDPVNAIMSLPGSAETDIIHRGAVDGEFN